MAVTDSQLAILKARLTRVEGRRNRPYVDTVGKVTIGVGHNLTDNGISDVIIEILLVEDIENATSQAKTLAIYDQLDPIRQTVLIDMVFNMGIDKVKEFKNTFGYLSRGDYDSAADEMLRSNWAREVGNRAIELSKIIRTGIVQGVNS